MIKDPEAHNSQAYVIFGEVTQFDSSTGTDSFRADVGPEKKEISTYGMVDYDENAMLSANSRLLSAVVEGDVFEAKIIILGSYSYSTTMGGRIAVPAFEVKELAVYGNTEE